MKLTVLVEDIGVSDETTHEFDSDQEIIQFLNNRHGLELDGGEYQYNVPFRVQYDDTYFKTFTVTE